MLRSWLKKLLADIPSGNVRMYCQMTSPVAASSAWMMLPGLVRYMTPSCTSGVGWFVPSAIAQTQASSSSPTLAAVMSSRGL